MKKIHKNPVSNLNTDSLALSQQLLFDGVWKLDSNNLKEGIINEGFWGSLGYSSEEILKDNENWQKTMLKNDLDHAISYFNDYINKPSGKLFTKLKFQHKNGFPVFMQTMGYLEKGEDGVSDKLVLTHSNITSQVNEEKEVVKEKDRLQDIVEGANIGTWQFFLDENKISCNEKFAAIIGYTLAEMQPVTLNSFIEYSHPLDLLICQRLIVAHVKGQTGFYESETRMRHKNGNWVWLHIKGRVLVRDVKGRALYLSGYIREITQQKNDEFLLLKYKNLLEKTNEAAKIGTWEVDLKTDEITWSAVTRSIHGVGANHAVTLDAAIRFYKPGKSRNTIKRLFKNAVQKGKNFDTELQIITQQGIEKWVRVVGIPVVKNGKCKKVYGSFQDIDEKTKAATNLELKEEQFRKTFEYAPIGMALVTPEGKWIKVNNSVCEMLGYTTEELLSLSFQEITHPEDINLDLRLLKELLAEERDQYQIEKRYFHKNGSIITILLSVSLVKDEKGKPIHFVSQINNITQHKKADQKIKSLLGVTRGQNKRLLNFAHIVSHNLRSHSGNLEMLLNLMEIEVPTATDNEFYPLLKEAVGNLEETVANLNEVANLNTRTLEVLDEVNVWKYINQASTHVSGKILENDVELHIDIPHNIKVKGVPAYVDSIFLNLLTNAIKYRSPDRKPFIDIYYEENDEYQIVNFKDNGLGINLELHQDNLFGMYKTFHNNKDSRGLGLFISKNQMEALGGHIKVESTLSQGSTFSLYFKK